MTQSERLAELHAEGDELAEKLNRVKVLVALLEDALDDIQQTADDIRCNIKWCEQDQDKAGD